MPTNLTSVSRDSNARRASAVKFATIATGREASSHCLALLPQWQERLSPGGAFMSATEVDYSVCLEQRPSINCSPSVPRRLACQWPINPWPIIRAYTSRGVRCPTTFPSRSAVFLCLLRKGSLHKYIAKSLHTIKRMMSQRTYASCPFGIFT